MSNFNVPSVGTMSSTGLTQQQVQVIWQNLVLQCLGVTPADPTDASAYLLVRVNWPTPGQPAWTITDDIAFVQCVEYPDRYNTAHEVQPITTSSPTYVETTIYTRVWQNSFTFYGPNSFDRARQVKACLYQDFVHDILESSNLYLDTVIGTPMRAPELFQNQWWEKTVFSCRMNEQVTDTLTKNTVQSVEVITSIKTGIISDVTVEL